MSLMHGTNMKILYRNSSQYSLSTFSIYIYVYIYIYINKRILGRDISYLGIQLSVSPTKLPSHSLFSVEQCLKETHTNATIKILNI